MAKSRRRFTAAFKAQLALSAISEQETMAELARRHKIHPTQIAKWKRELLENAASAFSSDRASTDASGGGVASEDRGTNCGARFFSTRARALPPEVRKELVTRDELLSVRRQCQILGVTRSSLYYKPVAESEEEISLMHEIDKLHLKYPFYGSRKIRVALRAANRVVNRKRVQRLMRKMGLESIAPKPNTSRPTPEHPVFPYLLRNMRIDRVNQVWASDITYIPMAHGFAYLVAIIDWYSRRIMSWRLSNTLDTRFCTEALAEALKCFGAPEIFNTDQGSQFTSTDFTKPLLDRGIKVSMDGRGRWLDNVFVERLWRSLKYEEVYLYAYDDLDAARQGIGAYFDFFNTERPHQALGYQAPAVFYDLLVPKAA